MEGKLGTGLVPDKASPTGTKNNSASQTARPRFKIKFTDYATDKFRANFIDPKTNKIRYRVYTPVDVSKHTALKGLKICQYYKSLKKYFVLHYWFNGKSMYITIGEFRLGVFGVRECEEKIYNIVKEHTNHKSIWIKDPQQTLKDLDNKIYETEQIKSQQKSIRNVIVEFMGQNMPKAESEGTLTSQSIKRMALYLFGYNKRSQHIFTGDDSKGNGKIYYKKMKRYGTKEPENAQDLFKKFPAGHGIIPPGKERNPHGELSLYDSEFSKLVIDKLTTGSITKYINQAPNNRPRSVATKDAILDAFKILWSYAESNGTLGDQPPINPCLKVIIKRPKVITAKSSNYNHSRFEPEDLEKLWKVLVLPETSKLHPFSTEAIMLMIVSGRRKEELSKISWKNIDEKKGIINLPSGITKTKKDQFITITPPVNMILTRLKEYYKKDQYKKLTFIPWLFPSIRTKSKELFDDEYIKSHGTRLKNIRFCWDYITGKSGVVGVPKMLRKTYASIGKLILKDTSKVRTLTGHDRDSTLDVHYDKTNIEKTKDYANEISARVFNFTKAGNE